jgi:hypothetical protein
MVESFKAEESLKSGHGLPPTIVSEDELVEVDLELSAADAVMGANQPLLQVTDGSVGQGDDRFGALAQFGSQGLNAGDMLKTNLVQARERFESIGVNGRAWSYVLDEKTSDGVGLEVRDDSHPKTSRRFPPLLDGNHHKRCPTSLELAASSNTSLGSADPGVVNFNFAAKRFASQVDHRPPKLVEHHPGGFVSSNAKLALEEQRRHTAFVGRHQVGSPEPQGQRRLRIVEDRARGQRHLVAAGSAFPPLPTRQRVATRMGATRTGEALWPTALSQIFLARLFGGEFDLKVAECCRKRRTRHPKCYRQQAT